MTDAELLAEVRSAVEDWERASTRRIAAIRAATEQRTRATTVDDIADAANLGDRASVYKLLRRNRPAEFPEHGGVGLHRCARCAWPSPIFYRSSDGYWVHTEIPEDWPEDLPDGWGNPTDHSATPILADR